MQVLARHPVVVKAGDQVELKGLGFKNTLALALFDASGVAVAQTLPVAVESTTTARFTVPLAAKPGIYQLNASQDGQSQTLSLVFTADMLESAIFASDAQNVCAGQKFYDLDGNVREGSKLCEAKASSTSTSTSSDPSVTPPECSRDGEVGCLATVDVPAVVKQGLQNKVIAGTTVAGVDGAVKLPTNCSQDGETGCLAVTNFPAVDKINKLTPGNIKSGVTIAEVTGAYPSAQYRLAGADSNMSDLPALSYTTGGASYEWFQSDGTRLSGSILANAQVTPGATTQTLSAGLYRSVTVAGDSNLADSNIKSGVNIFGIVGTVAPRPTDCASDGATGCVAVTNYPSVDKLNKLTPGNIKSGVIIANITGDYPSASHPLTGADSNTVDLPAFVDTTGGTAYEWFKSDGTRLSGSIQANAQLTPGASAQTLASGLYRSVTVAGDPNLMSSNIKTTVSIFGIAGNVMPTPSPCAADGASSCVVDGTNYKAAKLSQFANSDIKSGVSIAGIAGSLANCASDGGQACIATATYPAAEATGLAAKVVYGSSVAAISGSVRVPSADAVLSGVNVGVSSTGTVVLPSAGDVRLGVSFGANVSTNGQLDPGAGVPANCGSDGQTNCVAITNFPAVERASLANKVLSTATVAGVAGNVVLPPEADVYTGVLYGVSGNGSTGNLTLASAANVRSSQGAFGRGGNSVTPNLADCAADGASSCVVDGTAYKAAKLSQFANSDIKSGVTVAGVSGSLANCTADGDQGCVAVGPTMAAAVTTGIANKILSGNTIANVAGNVTLPAVGKVLSGTQFGVSGTGSTGTLTLPAAGNVLSGSGSFGDPGAAVTPSLTLPAAANVLAANGNFGVGGNGSTPTLTLPAAADVFTGIAYGVGGNGSTGSLTLASAANVRSSQGAFGRGGDSVTPTLADCAGDGATNCVAVTAYKAANMSNVTAANIKSGVTIAGVLGDYPSATNPLPNASITSDLTSLAATTAAGAYEWWDATGARYAGSISDAGTITPTTANQTFNTSLYRTFTVAGDAGLTSSNIKAGVSLFNIAGNVTPTPAICTVDGGSSCVVDGTSYKAAKLSQFANSDIKSGVTVAGVSGSLANCTSDGQQGCVAVGPTIAAAVTTGIAGKILAGNTIANVAGNVTLPAVGKVLSGTQFGVSGTGSTGTLTLPDAGHVLSGSGSFGDPGAAVTPTLTLPSAGNVLTSNGAFGVGGNGSTPTLTLPAAADVFAGISYGAGGNGSTGALTLPSAANVRTIQGAFGRSGNAVTPLLVDCAADGASDCVLVTGYKAAVMTNVTAGNIKYGVTIAGITGDYPSSTHKLADASDTSDLISLAATVSAGNYEWWNAAGTRYSGTITNAGSITPTTSDQTFNTSVYSGFTVVGDADLVASNIKTGVNLFNVPGNVTPIPANCASDGATDCVAVSAYPAIDKTGLADKVLSTTSVAGVTGNVTLPAVGKVFNNISYGVGGTSLVGTMTLPLSSNVVSGTPTYGDPGAPLTPSYSVNFPPIVARPGTPSITGSSFNFSPDRITLSWSAATGAAGYIVLMRSGSAVSWTPSDFTTYATGAYDSDTMIYSGSGTSVTYPTSVSAGLTYYFAVYAYETNKVYSATAATRTMLSCAGLSGGTWVAVPGDSVYGTNGFCVQKYIPSAVSGSPISQTGTNPWVSISQTTSKSTCSALGTGFHLITNPEWMTIAANIANTPSNWSNNVVGSGTMSRGHSDNNPGSACAADANDANAWVQDNCTGQTQGALAFNQRRTQNLSNGSVIWDFGGNVWQWVDAYDPNGKPGTATNAWNEYSAMGAGTANWPRSAFVPLNSVQSWWTDTWNSGQSIGQIYPGTSGSGGALLRGARWPYGTSAGPFAASLASIRPARTRASASGAPGSLESLNNLIIDHYPPRVSGAGKIFLPV